MRHKKISWLKWARVLALPIAYLLSATMLMAVVSKVNPKVIRLAYGMREIQVKRISMCSIRDFSGLTSSGCYADDQQVAVSEDLLKYKGWYVYIPQVGKRVFLITDTMHEKYSQAIDIYTYLSPASARAFGVKSGKVYLISPEVMFSKGIEIHDTDK